MAVGKDDEVADVKVALLDGNEAAEKAAKMAF
eukprot:CAMPEP_0170127690 /NCGR_PEP_ID=MMETSP0020_2-20130122/20617_1 /TAXON_ID=98059 /ORGANISM="Dinobryon sp., Strain UTEXLB2267" /LENGTH=31 /DNA_ID= /DNA_START= /DNA_END= /DNA_ORIENTATION=